ncbi:MAG: alpha/beta hydrolase [Thermoplasmatota archaeon]
MTREALAAVGIVLVLVASSLAIAQGGGNVHPITLTDANGRDTFTGYEAMPIGAPVAIVVVGHGYGHTASDWQAHLAEMASHGAVAIAMDYGNWQVSYGAKALIAARDVEVAAHPGIPVVLVGVSMGGAMTGLALREAPAGAFDVWMVSEGVSRLDETYVEANAAATIAPIAKSSVTEIEAECPDATARAQCLADRSFALHPDALAASGLKAAWVVHDVNDGLVPYDQALQSFAALTAATHATAFTTVLRGPCGDTGTTLTGYAGESDVACLAGHSDESSDTQAVIRTSLDLVDAYLDAPAPPTQGVAVTDAGLGTLP